MFKENIEKLIISEVINGISLGNVLFGVEQHVRKLREAYETIERLKAKANAEA
jgi:hypothetical protein